MTTVQEALPFNHLNQFKQTLLSPFKMSKKPKKILMIEDDQDIIAVVTKALKMKYSCIIDVAQDPYEAMNLMTEKFYDLIILDWQLPGLNGTETLAETEKGLRLEPGLPIQWDTKKVPVVIFSASQKNQCHPRRTKHFDYVGYISKSQPLHTIIESFGEFIQNEKTVRYQTA